MDPDLLLIFGFITLIVSMALIFGTIAGKRDREHKLQKLEMQARIEEAKAAQATRSGAEQADIEDRLRVLERIVTDPSTDLARQIEDLRELQNERERAS